MVGLWACDGGWLAWVGGQCWALASVAGGGRGSLWRVMLVVAGGGFCGRLMPVVVVVGVYGWGRSPRWWRGMVSVGSFLGVGSVVVVAG